MTPENARRFNELLEPHYRGAFAFACHLAGNRAEGADLFQDALVHAMERFGSLRAGDRFKPWLYRIVANLAHNRRRRARLVSHVTAMLGLAALTVSKSGESQALEREGVVKVLDRLPRAQREALVLVEIAGETLEMVAEIQKIPLGTAKSRLREARRKFQEGWQELDALPILPAKVQEGQS